jgi:hypothetical protein
MGSAEYDHVFSDDTVWPTRPFGHHAAPVQLFPRAFVILISLHVLPLPLSRPFFFESTSGQQDIILGLFGFQVLCGRSVSAFADHHSCMSRALLVLQL